MAFNLLVYYNAATGEAATGGIDALGNHQFFQRYADFGLGWTTIAATKDRVLYYNATTNAAATAQIDAAGYHQVLQRFTINQPWTHIAATEDHFLFYNATTGEAAIALLDAAGNATTLNRYNDFAQNWTNIAAIQNRLLYYNATTTEVATAEIDAAGDHRFVNRYAAGTTATWTHLTSTQNHFLFYNVTEGGGTVGRIDELGNYLPLHNSPDLSKTWNQIASTQRHVLFYSATLGVAATGEIDGEGVLRDISFYDQFLPELTHIVALKIPTIAPTPDEVTNPIVDLLRPDDLLNLNLRLLNLRLDRSDPANPVAIPHNPQQPSYLVVTFPPQTIVEQAFFESGAPDPAGIDEPTKQRVANDKTLPTTAPLPPGQVKARIGQPSRLVFRVPSDARIPYTTEGLLDWSGLELVVTPIADVEYQATPPDNALYIREPIEASDNPAIAPETAIELPYRLQISPRRNVVWDHAIKAVTHLGRTELWHTRLASRTEGKLQRTDEAHPQPLRAIWSPDFPKENLSPGGFGEIGVLTAMSPFDRKSIVILTSAFQGYANSPTQRFVIGQTIPYVPRPIYASQLMLSPLGGWLKSQGVWEPPYPVRINFNPQGGGIVGLFPREVAREINPIDITISPDIAQQLSRDRFGTIFPANISLGPQLDLSQWVHVATQGRDHYVRIVYEGRLKCTGHRAALIKVTERRFEEQPGTQHPIAYLRQYMYIVVREPEKDYRQKEAEEVQATLPAKLRGFPFSKIRLTTLVTPKIEYPYPAPANRANDPNQPDYNPASVTDCSFWVMVSKDYFRFHAIGTDAANQAIDFTIPLIFVPNSEVDFTKIEANYNDRSDIQRYERRRSVRVPGQKVTFAQPIDEKDNTSFITQELYFANYGTSTKADFFRLALFKASVRIPAVEQLLGKDTSTWIRLENHYVQNGFDHPDNATGVFAEIVKEDAGGNLVQSIVGLEFKADQAGGFATPNMDITNLSRRLGALGGNAANALQDSFDPAQYFQKAAKIFGSFDLAQLIVPSGTKEKNAPKMEIRRDGTAVTATLDWNPNIRNAGIPGALEFQKNDDTQLKINGVFKKDLGAPSRDDFLLTGNLNHFSLFFFDAVQINFDRFSFTSQSGKKTDVEVTLDDKEPIKFEGNLAFVEGLRKIIPPGVFGDGVSIDLIQSPLGVKASLSIGLPPAAVGVFALQNIAFTAGLTLPFLEGKPIFDFAFARRDNPFMLTIAFFGGGGFFHVEIDSDGLRSLEASFEFGAAAALKLVIASGEVHIMAGIYFGMKKITQKGKEIQVSLLTGYLRCGGKLSVLGIVSVSIEFYLAFTYQSTGKAYGTAILTITVEIFFFEKTFEIKVERSFGKDGNDPLFKQLMDTSDAWGEYAAAFA